VNTGFVHAFEDWGAKQIQVFYAAIAFSCETSCGNSCKKVFNFCLWEGLLWGQLQLINPFFCHNKEATSNRSKALFRIESMTVMLINLLSQRKCILLYRQSCPLHRGVLEGTVFMLQCTI